MVIKVIIISYKSKRVEDKILQQNIFIMENIKNKPFLIYKNLKLSLYVKNS